MDTTEPAPPSFTAVRSSRARWWLAAVALLAGCAHAAAEPLSPPFLRTDDMQLADAVVRGRDHSPTFRAILQRLAASDLIVYLRRGALFGTTAAATQFLSSAGGYRYVRVTLELSPSSDVGVAMLGHELRHALELADAPWVVDETCLLYTSPSPRD